MHVYSTLRWHKIKVGLVKRREEQNETESLKDLFSIDVTISQNGH